MKKIETSFLQVELNRVGEWIRFSDKKSAFLSAYYSAFIGLLISQKEEILKIFLNYENCLYAILIIGFIISFVLGVYFLIKSVFPVLKNNLGNHSLFYFGSIAKRNFSDYLKSLKGIDEEDFKLQIVEQIYISSTIAEQKMKNVQNSIKSLILSISIIIVLIIFS